MDHDALSDDSLGKALIDINGSINKPFTWETNDTYDIKNEENLDKK